MTRIVDSSMIPSIKTALGTHLLLELYDCPEKVLNNEKWIESAMVTAAKNAGATVVESVFHSFSKQGVSGVVVIAESHLTIHTWPEHGYAALDVFTCGHEKMPKVIEEELIREFQAKRSESSTQERGVMDRIEKLHNE